MKSERRRRRAGCGREATGRLLLRIRRRRGAWDEPIGLLTHHLDHDALPVPEPVARHAEALPGGG
jgi:hypothetical protein